MNVLEMIVAIILLIFAFKGLKQGLIMTVCSFVTLFLAIALTQLVTPQVSSVIRENENIVSFLSGQVEHVLFESKTSKEDKAKSEKERIEGLSVPRVLKQELIENNVKGTYEEIGATNFQQYLSIYVAYSIINSITYLLVFIIILSLLKVFAHALNLVSRLPVIHTLNKVGGLGIGILEGLLITWIAFVVITVFCSNNLGIVLYKQVEDSTWLKYLYNNNIILNAIIKVTKVLF